MNDNHRWWNTHALTFSDSWLQTSFYYLDTQLRCLCMEIMLEIGSVIVVYWNAMMHVGITLNPPVDGNTYLSIL